jgi:hypothetical protein
MPATFFSRFDWKNRNWKNRTWEEWGLEMTYSIFARDGTSRIVLKRESREAAEKKASELTDLGWFEVHIAEEALMDEAQRAGTRHVNG